MNKKQIDLPVGTSVSFENDPYVYQISYQELLGPCPKDCDWDHDCYEEAYVTVYTRTGTAKPLSSLKSVFDSNGLGHPYKPNI